eukprot:gene7964-1180_t
MIMDGKETEHRVIDAADDEEEEEEEEEEEPAQKHADAVDFAGETELIEDHGSPPVRPVPTAPAAATAGWNPTPTPTPTCLCLPFFSRPELSAPAAEPAAGQCPGPQLQQQQVGTPQQGGELQSIDIAYPVLAIGPDNEKILHFSELFKQEERDLHRFYLEFLSDLDRKHRVKTRQERREATAKGGQGALDEEDEALVLQQLLDEETLRAMHEEEEEALAEHAATELQVPSEEESLAALAGPDGQEDGAAAEAGLGRDAPLQSKPLDPAGGPVVSDKTSATVAMKLQLHLRFVPPCGQWTREAPDSDDDVVCRLELRDDLHMIASIIPPKPKLEGFGSAKPGPKPPADGLHPQYLRLNKSYKTS